MKSRTAFAVLAAFLLLSIPLLANAQTRPIRGVIAVEPGQMKPGDGVSLVGEWLYKPGYLLAAGEQPQSSVENAGYVPVGVPQFLNRVQWWLDDSEDFKRDEEARLKKLGFDTNRAEDGWYRLWLDVPKLQSGRQLFIEFDGIAMKSKIFCNGKELGEHTGMFSRFGFDLTPHLKPGKNLISIYVSMEKIPPSELSLGQAVTVNLTASKIMSLSKGMFGPLSPNSDNRAYELHGIWQPVKLVVRDGASINDAWFNPSLDGAKVQVEARSASGPRSAVLKARWTDKATGRRFAEAPAVKVELGGDAKRTTLSLANVKPKLWTPADPNLYLLEVTLETDQGVVLDRWTHNVGFRTFEIKDSKFYLNGKPYWLRGGNQLPYGKNPWDNELPRKLIKLMHDGNQRVTRTHATPWNEAWLNAADEIGLGVSIEGIRPWALAGKIGTPPAEIFQHWLTENEDVVRRGRNHPSVLLWTIGNEMLLRDGKNVEKWKLVSDVIKQTRSLDPYRPVVADSTYQRDDEFYSTVLKPNGIDDGDVDDIHRYRGWYAESAFVTDSLFKSEFEARKEAVNRPFIGQEMSPGYPDLDTGLPVLRYTRDLVTPQAWVGQDAYPGNDPAVFLEHHRAVTKRWAEQLRFQRGDRTAGFILFSAECWFSHSYDAKRVSPYPVIDALRQAFAPVGLALETSRRRFSAGEQLATSVYVTNDDEQFRDYNNLTLKVELVNQAGKTVLSENAGKLDAIKYYETRQISISLTLPKVSGERQSLTLRLILLAGGKEISRTDDRIEVFNEKNGNGTKGNGSVIALSVSPDLKEFVQKSSAFSSVEESLDKTANARVVVVGGDGPLDQLADGGKLREFAANGGTVLVVSPGKKIDAIFPSEILSFKTVTGEYADIAPIAGTPLAAGLGKMDLKWWGRKNDWRVFVASGAHRLQPNGTARELVRFIPAHGYISEERVPEQYMTVLFQIPVGKGRIWICDLDLDAAISVDPAARLFTTNLLKAAADLTSTRNLPIVPTHAQQLAGKGASTPATVK